MPGVLETLEEWVDSERAALLVVDMQNTFCHPEGAAARRGGHADLVEAMAPRLVRFISGARNAGVPVIFIRAENDRWTLSEVQLEHRQRRGPVAPGAHSPEWETAFYAVSPLEGECVVTKHRYSGFIGTDLDLILRAQGIETVICTGVGTHVCVESTARDAFMLDYYTVFVEDCCATPSGQEFHDGALRSMRSRSWIAKADDVEACWTGVPVAAG